MKTKQIIGEKAIPIMDERVFLDDSYSEGISSSRHTFAMRFDQDSYIWCFEGRRGGGKTTAMSFFVVRSVALYNMKVVSNFPIEFELRRYRPDGQSYLQHVKAEPLDFERLICFDQEYRHCLICIDEAPEVISYMASQSWRNRLVAAFTRQLRKNFNTLFLAAQDFELVDKAMRWQVDVIIQCRDAARYIGDTSGLERGEMLWLNWYDHSGQWTGQTTEDRLRRGENPRLMQMQLFPRLMWGDDDHKPVFDSWHQIDILDSLRKVDLRLSSIKVSDKSGAGGEKYPVSIKTLKEALHTIEIIFEERPDQPNIFQKYFYQSLGGVTDQDKNNLAKKLSNFNVERGGEGSKRWYGFSSFNLELFRDYVKNAEGGA